MEWPVVEMQLQKMLLFSVPLMDQINIGPYIYEFSTPKRLEYYEINNGEVNKSLISEWGIISD